MRNESTMMALILGTARQDVRIRAVILNGSRANPDIKKDIFQDYDILYAVTDTAPFIRDRAWIDRFGARLYLQRPEELDAALGRQIDFTQNYGWLIQFEDGNRLDLHVCSLQHAKAILAQDSLSKILLDKDRVFSEIPAPSDKSYRVLPPDELHFYRCCNDFWWVQNNVGKGLWREELTYALEQLNFFIRPELLTMLSWYAGIKNGAPCAVGKAGKYLWRYLPPEDWHQFLATYPAAETEEIWRAVFTACDLFDRKAREVAEEYQLFYNTTEAENSQRFLRKTKALPQNAQEID